MTAKEIIKELEEHCNEKLKCSRRLRFQIEQSFQRIINDNDKMKGRIINVLEGMETYDPKVYKTILLPKNK